MSMTCPTELIADKNSPTLSTLIVIERWAPWYLTLMGKVTGELASLGGTMQDCVQYMETSTNRRIIATFQYHKKRAHSIENILRHLQLTLLPEFDELPTKDLMQRWLRGVQINQRVTADAQHAAFQTSDTARMIECLYNERMVSNNVMDVDLAADFVPMRELTKVKNYLCTN